mgnify:CR=1 FL=1
MSYHPLDARATHNHDDDTPTIGCPACIAIVRHDQERARWADAPLRRTHWLYAPDDGAECVEFAVVLPVPTGADVHDVHEFYEDIIADATPIDTTDAPAPWWLCTRIGGIVPDVATPAPAEAPTLFDGAA